MHCLPVVQEKLESKHFSAPSVRGGLNGWGTFSVFPLVNEFVPNVPRADYGECGGGQLAQKRSSHLRKTKGNKMIVDEKNTSQQAN